MADIQPKKVGTGSYIIAGLGLIPGVGIIFASIAVILGFINRQYGGKKLIVMGCLGIMLTAGLYGALIYQVFSIRDSSQNSAKAGLLSNPAVHQQE